MKIELNFLPSTTSHARNRVGKERKNILLSYPRSNSEVIRAETLKSLQNTKFDQNAIS